MKKLLILLFLHSPFWLFAQADLGSEKYLSIRGKAFAFFVVEDHFFNNITIGIEYRFHPRHSVGADFVHFRWRYQHDIYEDGYDTGSGPNSYKRRQYLLVDYRYYPFEGLMQDRGYEFYLNALTKLGQRKIWAEENTGVSDEFGDYVYADRSDFQDHGLAIGSRKMLGEYSRWFLDVSMGAVYRKARILYQEGHHDNSNYTIHGGTYALWQFHMRLNLSCNILYFSGGKKQQTLL